MEKNKRLNQIILVVGRRGCGKTTLTKELVVIRKLPTLLVDTFDHPDWREGFTDKSIPYLKNWKKGNIRIYDSEPEVTLLEAFKKCANCVIVMEDCKRYVEASGQKWLRKGIVEHRNRNVDLIMMFHSLKDIPPYVASNHNLIILFKTNDNMDVPLSKFSNWNEIKKTHERVMKHKTPWYSEVVTLQ